MKPSSGSNSGLSRAIATGTSALDETVRAIVREEVERVLASKQGPASSPYYTQHDAPMSKRRFLEAARAAEFQSFKRGKTVYALRTDVDSWIASGQLEANGPERPVKQKSQVDVILGRIGSGGRRRG